MGGGGGGGHLFEAGCLLTFSVFRMDAYSRLGAYSNKYGNYERTQIIYLTAPSSFTINPLSPKSDQHQLSPNNIDTYSRGKIR